MKLHRKSGAVEVVRNQPDVATIVQPGQPTREVALHRRRPQECLSEELRRLDPDDAFGKVIKFGFGSSKPVKPAVTGKKGVLRAKSTAK